MRNGNTNQDHKWTCQSCGGWNWPDRVACFRCHAKKSKPNASAKPKAGDSKDASSIDVNGFILVGKGKQNRKRGVVLRTSPSGFG